MPIEIEELRRKVDEEIVGFAPNTNSVKPVHIFNGLARLLLGETADTSLLYRFVIAQKEDGKVPSGHELTKVFKDLSSRGRLDPNIGPETLVPLRTLLKAMVAADSGVFAGGFDSYSAASQAFVSRDRVAQDGGEMIGAWLKRKAPALAQVLETSLREGGDPVSVACSPFLSDNLDPYSKTQLFVPDGLPEPHQKNLNELWEGLSLAADTLASHLELQDNHLLTARSTALFASFAILRHLGTLETRYVAEGRQDVIPWLVSFDSQAASPVSRASSHSYTLCCQSISRFYAWAFGKSIEDRSSFEVLSEVPKYKQRTATDDRSKERRQMTVAAGEVWEIATEGLTADSDDVHKICGQALYDMMALEAEGNPIIFFRQLGSRMGLLDPASSKHPNKRFRPQQDLLEVLIRGAIAPGEALDLTSLLGRLWERYGLIVGGRIQDHKRLLGWGISQADTSALAQNQIEFCRLLSNLGFAEMLADGVLKVRFEGSNAV